MRRRHDNSALSERNATALRRLAVIGARLAEDRRAAGSAARPEVDDGAGAPCPAPDAGRHLAPSAPTRSPLLSGLHDRLPMSVHARLGGAGLTAHHVVVVVAVVIGFIALAVWWLVSAQPSEVTPLSSVQSTSAPARPSDDASSPVDATASTAAKGKVVVDVTGKVRKPGIVSLRHGARVADAIEAAGGPRSKRVDLRALNLARVLVDGEQIVVGLPALPGATTTPEAGSTAPPDETSSAAPVNLNAATLEQLETLPGVGPVTAQAIVDWRTEHGQFTSVDELLEVNGIGEVTLEDLRDLVSV
ncbi:MAG TPA: helix-hairpin-helix domain-containing protein [Nocardioidaceae bacterium]|nr:helix-hairpin-helix domain-containing protein [Nocardioidaceae bacterium]